MQRRFASRTELTKKAAVDPPERVTCAVMNSPDAEPITDLKRLLSTLTVSQRSGTFCMATAPSTPSVGHGVEALIVEHEGITAICSIERAEAEGWDYEFPSAWLTLDVYSALEAVGLTAAVARVLTDANIPCNVIAARRHDHILVPAERAAAAIDAIESLANASAS